MFLSLSIVYFFLDRFTLLLIQKIPNTKTGNSWASGLLIKTNTLVSDQELKCCQDCQDLGLNLLWSHKTAEQRTVIQQYGDWYTAVDGWTVTFGTVMRGLGGLQPCPVPSSLYQM